MSTSTTIANAKIPAFSPTVCALTVAMELAQKIEGPGDEHRISRLQRPRARALRAGLDLDAGEEPLPHVGELSGRHDAAVPGLRRDQRVPEDRQRLEHQLRPLVAQR